MSDQAAADNATDGGRPADAAWFRRVLGQYPTGVCVVTGITAEGVPVGMAVGSFTSVSLDPPLVAFLPAVSSSTWPKIEAAGRFCVNILAADQEHLCRAFASKGADKFADLRWRPAGSGAPILTDAVAWIDCHLETVHESGDHVIALGRVRDLDIQRPTLPLLFFQGGYGRFSPHSLTVRDSRFGLQLQVVDRARSLMETVAERTGGQVVASYCDGIEMTLLASAGTPTDPHAQPASIGQHLPVTAPIGIWWMAWAPAAQVEQWLHGISSPDLRNTYRQALTLIRQRGYCFGLRTVHHQIERMISSRPGPGVAPTAEERHAVGTLTPNPMDYVPSADRHRYAPDHARPDVVSLWAPTFTADGAVALGLMLTGYPRDAPGAQNYAGALLELAAAVTSLTTRQRSAHGLSATDTERRSRAAAP